MIKLAKKSKPKYPTLTKDWVERKRDYKRHSEILKLPPTYKMIKVKGKKKRFRLVYFGGMNDAKKFKKKTKNDGYYARIVEHDAGLTANLVYIRKKGR